jgi:hypothetical protein
LSDTHLKTQLNGKINTSKYTPASIQPIKTELIYPEISFRVSNGFKRKQMLPELWQFEPLRDTSVHGGTLKQSLSYS